MLSSHAAAYLVAAHRAARRGRYLRAAGVGAFVLAAAAATISLRARRAESRRAFLEQAHQRAYSYEGLDVALDAAERVPEADDPRNLVALSLCAASWRTAQYSGHGLPELNSGTIEASPDGRRLVVTGTLEGGARIIIPN
jgi:hypothetical protein